MIFQFQLEGEHLNRNQSALDNGYIEGDLQIYVDGQLYLTKAAVNVVELATQLGKWLHSVTSGDICNFAYESIDCDEPLLRFLVQEKWLKIQSSIENYEQTVLPVETVRNAVINFLIELNIMLHRLGYVVKLDHLLTGIISENRRAIMLFEQNNYDDAFVLIKKLANETPSIQSLNNLAWFMLREEEDQNEAQRLLKQVLSLSPQSSFPYMMLGEIALHHKQYAEAKSYLQQALSFNETENAIYNLALAHFQLGEFEQAAKTFARCEGDSGMTQLHEVVCWLYASNFDHAKALLANWNDEADDYTGAIEIADVYVELGCYSEARTQFEKEWENYYVSPYIVSRYAYTLWKLEDYAACRTTIQQAIQQNKEEINDERQRELCEHFTAQERDECVLDLIEQQQTLKMLWQRLENGDVPPFEYDMYPSGGCQLFGCMQHGNPEYEEVK